MINRHGGPRPTGENRADLTRARLIAATLEVLNQWGHASTTIQRVCEATGLSNGALFRHFPSREALLKAVAESLVELVTDGLLGAPNEPNLPLRQRLIGSLQNARALSRSSVGVAWRELLVAARTSEGLAASVYPGVQRTRDALRTCAATLSGQPADHPSTRRLELVLLTVLDTLNGEALSIGLAQRADDAGYLKAVDERLVWLAELLADEVERARGPVAGQAPPPEGVGLYPVLRSPAAIPAIVPCTDSSSAGASGDPSACACRQRCSSRTWSIWIGST
jgi:AcrR family transcriptional regulator